MNKSHFYISQNSKKQKDLEKIFINSKLKTSVSKVTFSKNTAFLIGQLRFLARKSMKMASEEVPEAFWNPVFPLIVLGTN